MAGDQDSKRGQTGKTKGRVNIKVSDSDARGVYSNLSILHSNDVEFVMDFIFAEPQRRQGHVVSRVVTHPKAAKRLLKGLTELVKNYEERYGEIPLKDTTVNPSSTYH